MSYKISDSVAMRFIQIFQEAVLLGLDQGEATILVVRYALHARRQLVVTNADLRTDAGVPRPPGLQVRTERLSDDDDRGPAVKTVGKP